MGIFQGLCQAEKLDEAAQGAPTERRAAEARCLHDGANHDTQEAEFSFT